jgi:hypothetical protein
MRVAAAVVATVVAASVAGCASASTRRTVEGQTSAAVSNRKQFLGGGPTAGRSWRHGLLSLAPPSQGQFPKVSAETVYQGSQSGCVSALKRPSRQPVIEYGDYTDLDYGTVQSNGTVKPIYDGKLVWLCMYLGVPAGDIQLTRGGSAAAPNTGSASQSAPSVETGLSDVIVVVDPETGRALDLRTEPSTIRDATFIPSSSANLRPVIGIPASATS